MLGAWLARLGREGEWGRTEFDNHLAPWDIAFPELETIGDAAPSTELDGFPVGRAGVLVFRAGVGDAADGDGEEGVGVGEGGGVVAEELSAGGGQRAAPENEQPPTYRGPGPAFLATKLSVMDLTLGERGRLAVALRRAANVCDTGAGIFFCSSHGGWKRQAEERDRMKIVRGARHVGRGSPCETNTPPRESGRVITSAAGLFVKCSVS